MDAQFGTAVGKCFLDMLGVFAEFETNLRRERQLEGIAKATAEGVYKGRPASIDAARVREMKAAGIGPPQRLRRPSRLAGQACTECWKVSRSKLRTPFRASVQPSRGLLALLLERGPRRDDAPSLQLIFARGLALDYPYLAFVQI